MLRAVFPDLGKVYTSAAANIKNAYGGTTTTTLPNISGCKRVRFYVHVVTDAGSTLVTVTLKLKMRYVSPDGTVTRGYIDLPSNLDDVQGAAQPKGNTFEIEHSFATGGAGQDKDFSFYLDHPEGLSETAIDMHANAAGAGTDLVEIYARAG
jgi:hypothetical protein